MARRSVNRNQAVIIPFDPEMLVDMITVDFDDDVEQLDEVKDRIDSEVEALPLEQRAVMELAVWGQMSWQAIADKLEMDPRTVRTRYQQGKAVLRERLGDLV